MSKRISSADMEAAARRAMTPTKETAIERTLGKRLRPQMVRKTYSLPVSVANWIIDQASTQGISESAIVRNVLEAAMAASAHTKYENV